MSRNNRLLFGYGDNDFESLVLQNMLKFDLLESIDDYEFYTQNSDLKIRKGNSEIITFDSNSDITIHNNLSVNGNITFNKNNLVDPTIKTIGLTNSGADYEISASDDIGSLITSLINSDNIIIKIYQGDYTLTTSIVINNNNVKIEGMHRENTKIVSDFTNDNIIEISNSSGGGVSISNVSISNFTISNTSYLNYGVIGIYCNGMRNCNIKDINIQQCYTALKLDDRNFFNDIETLRTTHCYDTLIIDGPGSSNKPNQNTFSKCLFNNNQNDILLLNRGNNNFFNHCSFEVWTGTAVYVDDANGNTFNSCRYEPAIAVSYYINLTSNSRENVFNNSYFTDNNLSWVDFDTSINDNGEGNCVDSLNSFKTQRVRWKRRHANSENFIEFIRTGYGDDTSILTLDDQYSSSGNPIQLSLKSSRITGKFISGYNNTTENFYVGNNGDTFIGGLLSFADNDTGFEGVSDGVFRIMNDNNETMRFNSDGKVGIGSNNPDEILHIEGDSPILKISNTQETWSGIRFCDSAAPTTQNFDILYSASNQDLKIRSDDIDNIMYFEYNNGFIGLGLDDPTCPIHLNNTNGTLMKLERTGSAGDGLYTELKNPAGTRLLIGIGGSGFTGTDDTSCIIGNWSDGDLEFRTNGSRRMTIKADGNVGIGIETPTEPLHIVNSGTIARMALFNSTNATTTGSFIEVINNAGTRALFGCDGSGYGGGSTADVIVGNFSSGELQFVSAGAVAGAFDNVGDLRLFNKLMIGGDITPTIDLAIGDVNTGFLHSGTDDLRWMVGGTSRFICDANFVYAYGSSNAIGNPSMIIKKNATGSSSNVFINFLRSATSASSGGSFEGGIRTNGSGNLVIDNTSDLRLKENIVDYTNGYNKVKDLRIVEYEWKDAQKKSEIGRVVGIIAQELQEVLPKAIGSCKINDEDDTDYLTISYSELIPFNWSATRTLIDKVETLESKIKIFEDNYENIKLDNSILKTQITDILIKLQLLENK